MYLKGSLIDPPSGWKYGFPKELDRDLVTGRELREWIIANGYPYEVMASFPNGFPIRVIANIDESNDVASLQATIDSQSIMIQELIQERDEARKEYCTVVSCLCKGEVTPAKVAQQRGWDCFIIKEENNNG